VSVSVEKAHVSCAFPTIIAPTERKATQHAGPAQQL
jgi:hypothetical protein